MFNFYCLCGTKQCLKAAHFLHLYTRRWMVSSSMSFLSIKCTMSCKCTFGSKLIKCALSSKNSLVTLLILTEFLGSQVSSVYWGSFQITSVYKDSLKSLYNLCTFTSQHQGNEVLLWEGRRESFSSNCTKTVLGLFHCCVCTIILV